MDEDQLPIAFATIMEIQQAGSQRRLTEYKVKNKKIIFQIKFYFKIKSSFRNIEVESQFADWKSRNKLRPS